MLILFIFFDSSIRFLNSLSSFLLSNVNLYTISFCDVSLNKLTKLLLFSITSIFSLEKTSIELSAVPSLKETL